MQFLADRSGGMAVMVLAGSGKLLLSVFFNVLFNERNFLNR